MSTDGDIILQDWREFLKTLRFCGVLKTQRAALD
jgi:hypothetical protein